MGAGKERLVPKAGLYQRGLLKSLMTWAIPTPTAEYSLKPVRRSLFHLVGFCRHLLVRLTPIKLEKSEGEALSAGGRSVSGTRRLDLCALSLWPAD
jgi:hypothetical protein